MSEAPSVTNEAVTARVVAVHKETSIVRGPDGFDRPAIVSGRFRFEALAPSDYPAVGDWVTLANDPAFIEMMVDVVRAGCERYDAGRPLALAHSR